MITEGYRPASFGSLVKSCGTEKAQLSEVIFVEIEDEQELSQVMLEE